MKDKANILHGISFTVNEFEDVSIGQLIFNQLAKHGTRLAQINAHTGEKRSYDQIFDISKKLAVYLNKSGLKLYDCVAICSENNLEFCIVMCSCYFLGITICPLNPSYTERELLHALNISKPKHIFVSQTAVTVMQETIKKLSWLPKLVMLNDFDNNLPSIKTVTSDIYINDVNNFKVSTLPENDHTVAILYSSGTTGLPKGVMLTNKNFLTVIKHCNDPTLGILNKNVIILNLLPYFHAYSFAVLTAQMAIGPTHIILSRFEENIFLKTIEKYKIDLLILVPPLMVFLAKHPVVNKYDLSSIKRIWCGAAPLSKEIQSTVAKRFRITNINQGYGLTETTLAVLLTPDGKNKYNSVGILAPETSAKIVPMDEPDSNKTLGPYSEGELCFKGNLIMKGYCNDEKSTKAMIDKDGWLHTGDIGYYDNDGYFYIVDRLKELIKFKGYQVPPAELEAILLTYPGIKDAAVIGQLDKEAGELPVAFVVKQNGFDITEEDVIKYVNERVSNPKKLRGGVKFVQDIPKTASGKILRRLLRDTLTSKL